MGDLPFLINVKKVRQFRDKVQRVLQEREAASNLEGLEEIRTEIGLETVLYIVEHARQITERGGSASDLIALFKSVFHAEFLLLESIPDGTLVRHNDFDLPSDLTAALTLPTGIYGQLSRIRFTHLFDSRSAALQSLETSGHPSIITLIAIPLIRRDRPTGCLAAALPSPLPLDATTVLLLSIAAELVTFGRG